MGSDRPRVRGDDGGSINRPAGEVKSPRGRLPAIANLRSGVRMDDGEINSALDRTERALQRIERALASRRPGMGRDDELRAKVREVVEELDELIREAAA
jgi:uncharacterized protein YhaN